jgi:CTP synthase
MCDIGELIAEAVKQNKKFIVVTGGVCSSLGKGVLISSIGNLLKNAGYSVNVMKCDPYFNVDPGTMSPLVHGEVFVTDDGAETDLDLGHYERALGVHLNKLSSVSSGQIYQRVLEGERKGEYLGRCIQIIPHVVDRIKKRILDFAFSSEAEFILIEIGGTVGDMEADVYLESLRQLRQDLGANQFFHAHLSYVPLLSWIGELKTKPTQHSVMLLKQAGLIPDGLFLRTDMEMSDKSFNKVSLMCGVKRDFVFQVLTHDPLYNLFLDLYGQKLHEKLQKWFGLKDIKDSDLSEWRQLIERIRKEKKRVRIGLIVKYIGGQDTYVSVLEAIKSAAYHSDRHAEIIYIDAEKIENNDSESMELLKSVDGIVVPGGFDERGIEGKVLAAKWARENNVPYLGLCLGMQVVLIEFARSVAGLEGASSTEFAKDSRYPVIVPLEDQIDIEEFGGSMRLGAYPCEVMPGTLAHEAYGVDTIKERHRHRYEFNNDYRDDLEKQGIVFSGIFKEKNLVEIVEVKGHPFMLGCQFHPEFLSSPLKPHPLFKKFIDVILEDRD